MDNPRTPFENDLQNIMYSLLDQYIRPNRATQGQGQSQAQAQAPAPAPAQAQAPAQAPAQVPTRAQTPTFNELYMLILRETMEDYNINMRRFLTIMENPPIQTFTPVPEPPPRQTRRAANDRNFLFTYYYPLQPPQGSLPNMQNVIVRPSDVQIATATRRITYSVTDLSLNARCPIRLEDFVEGQQICQIIHCRHAFTEESIHDWFQTNVRCPVCRYDVRDYRAPEPEIEHTDSSMNSLIENMLQDLINEQNPYL
jgi:hypothetical protein